jgi:hypothetical protein
MVFTKTQLNRPAVGFAPPAKHPITNSMAQRRGSADLFEEGFVGVPILEIQSSTSMPVAAPTRAKVFG